MKEFLIRYWNEIIVHNIKWVIDPKNLLGFVITTVLLVIIYLLVCWVTNAIQWYKLFKNDHRTFFDFIKDKWDLLI